jgi:CHAT domain-containing protein
MLLIGSHGQNYPDQPLASEVLMHPAAGDNGRLTAATLYTSPVQTDLVVLSACYTALADRSPLPGDDLFGLSRALLQSGGRTVVTGYWDVFEGTGPEIMRGFFDKLSRGQPVPAALAEAQREFLAPLRKSTEPEPYLHPYFWAVFGAQGDDRTQFEKPRS